MGPTPVLPVYNNRHSNGLSDGYASGASQYPVVNHPNQLRPQQFPAHSRHRPFPSPHPNYEKQRLEKLHHDYRPNQPNYRPIDTRLPPSYAPDYADEDADDERDYFVIKPKPKPKRKRRRRKPQVIEVDLNDSPYEDFDDDDEDVYHDASEKLVLKVVKQTDHGREKQKRVKYYYRKQDQYGENPYRRGYPDQEAAVKDSVALASSWNPVLATPNTTLAEATLTYGRFYNNNFSRPISMQRRNDYSRKSLSNHRNERSGDTFDMEDFDYNYDDTDDNPNRRMDIDTTYPDIRKDKKAVFSVPRRPPISNYTKWSRWSKCSAKCTTRRFKKCRVQHFCGNDVIREIAYCYTEGSFCQEWIGNQLQTMNQAIETTSVSTTTMYSVQSKKPSRLGMGNGGRGKSRRQENNAIASNRMSNRRSGWTTQQSSNVLSADFDCGIPVVRDKRKNNVYNMLRIIGGKAARRGAWPWQVAILNRFKEAFCGGTLISPHW